MSPNYLSLFCKTICCKELVKIAQSGHTVVHSNWVYKAFLELDANEFCSAGHWGFPWSFFFLPESSFGRDCWFSKHFCEQGWHFPGMPRHLNWLLGWKQNPWLAPFLTLQKPFLRHVYSQSLPSTPPAGEFDQRGWTFWRDKLVGGSSGLVVNGRDS